MRFERTSALLSIVVIAVLVVIGCGSDEEDTAAPPGTAPTVASPAPDYEYREDTLVRHRLLLDDHDWRAADPPRNAQGMLQAVHEKTGLRFVLIPAFATVLAYSGVGDPEDQKTVFPPAFLLSKLEVSVAQFRLFDPEALKGFRLLHHMTDPEEIRRHVEHFKRDDLPMRSLTWKDAELFCAWMSSDTVTCRLPTEAEWEYASRAGTEGRFPWGNDATRLDEYVVHRKNSWAKQPPGTRSPNSWGIHDMLGNVWEFTADPWSRGDEKPEPPVTEWPNRVAKGGAWSTPSDRFGVSIREERFADGHCYGGTGFRPAADLPPLRAADGD